jgi:hypothetical protein
MDHYILVGRTPILVDLWTWAQSFERFDARRIDFTVINDRCEVSTVFLGIDHNYGRGDPVLFETMTFGGPLDSEQRRYSTYSEAERGHSEAVTQAKIACARVDAILTPRTFWLMN